MNAPELLVLVDSREQRPLRFPVSRVAALRTGDYSVAGFEDRIALERKDHEDLVRCVGHDRARFRDQVERLAAMEYGALILEPSIDQIRIGSTVSRMNPAAVLQTLLSWSVRYRLPVWFCGDRENARGVVHGLLRHFVRHHGDPAAAAALAFEELGRSRGNSRADVCTSSGRRR